MNERLHFASVMKVQRVVEFHLLRMCDEWDMRLLWRHLISIAGTWAQQ
jgi:hypothetical protein